MKEIMNLDFYRFDGEGGSAPGAASEGPGQEASAPWGTTSKTTINYNV